MMEKRCSTVRDHKPHLWSRTTRKTVTEETAGDTFQCPGKANLELRSEKGERMAQIALDARSGRNWASESPVRPACLCGAGARTQVAAQALKGAHGRPQGFCARHPGGSVWAPPPGLWEQIKKGESDG